LPPRAAQPFVATSSAAPNSAASTAAAMQAAQHTFFGGAGEELHTHSKKTIFLGETLAFLVQN
jgi:hypothetical protein